MSQRTSDVPLKDGPVLRFGDVSFDPARRLVLRGPRPVHLEPRAFRLLELLLSCRPKALSKAEILEAVWPDTFVTEGSLSALVWGGARVTGPTPLADGDELKIGVVRLTYRGPAACGPGDTAMFA